MNIIYFKGLSFFCPPLARLYIKGKKHVRTDKRPFWRFIVLFMLMENINSIKRH